METIETTTEKKAMSLTVGFSVSMIIIALIALLFVIGANEKRPKTIRNFQPLGAIEKFDFGEEEVYIRVGIGERAGEYRLTLMTTCPEEILCQKEYIIKNLNQKTPIGESYLITLKPVVNIVGYIEVIVKLKKRDDN